MSTPSANSACPRTASGWDRRSVVSTASSRAPPLMSASGRRCWSTRAVSENPGVCLILMPVGRDAPACARLVGLAGLAPQVCDSVDDLLERLDLGAEVV